MLAKKILLGAGILLAAAGAQAATIAYDDFATDGDLAGSTGGSGFSTNWYDNVGGYFVGGGVATGGGSSFRTLSSTLGSNGTIWVSFDYGVDSDQNTWGGLSFFEGGAERMIIGDTYGQDLWGLDGKAGSTKANSTNSTLGFKTGVAKITLGSGASSVVRLWVGDNTTDPVECPTVADVTITSVTLENCDTLRISTGGTLNFGDLIIGDTAADVGAVEVVDSTLYADYTSGSWTNESNWSDGLPAAADDAILGLGASVTLDTVETVAELTLLTDSELMVAAGGDLTCTDLTLGSSVALEIANGGSAAIGSDVTLSGGTTLTIGLGAAPGTLAVDGVLNLGSAQLIVDGTMESFEEIILTANDGITNSFVNLPDTTFVQNVDGYNYYIHYVTNTTPNYITINTNGVQGGGGVVIPPRPSEDDMVAGYDQRYMAYDYDMVTGTWTDYVGTATAEAINTTDFSITTNTPNGRPAVENSGNIGVNTAMNFTRANAVATNGFTIQAVIRIDEGNTDARQGPFACDEATSWSGLFMGARASATSNVRAGNIGDTRSGTYVLAGSVDNTVTAGTWGIYTLVVDPDSTPQMTATFDLLEDGQTAFTIEATVPTTTNWVGGISASGRLFGGDMGGGADGDTDNWQGAIADLVVYDRPLTSVELSENEAAFQSIYLDEIVYVPEVGDVSVELNAAGTEVTVSFGTTVGSTFWLEATERLSPPSWGQVGETFDGTGSEVSVTVAVSNNAFFQAHGE